MLQRWSTGIVLVGLAVVLILGVGRGQTSADQAAETRAAVQRAIKQAQVKPGTGPVGRRVANFVLPDTTGKQIGLADFSDKKLVIIVSLGTGCPISNLYLPDLIAAQKEFGDKFLQIIGINSQSGDTREAVAAHAQKFGINFPVLCDPDQTAADLLGIQRTAETFLLDPQRVVRYHGRIDDNHRDPSHVTAHDLKNALDALLAGNAVPVETTTAFGCSIKWK